jgi:RimJ/RimL family protein N-acetyltransferase
VITVARCTDYEFISAVFRHPDVWPFICDDYSSDPEWFRADCAGRVYVVPSLDGIPMGCFSLNDCNGSTVEMHTAILPEFRGPTTAQAFAVLLDFIEWEHPNVKRLRTWVPAFNTAAYKGALHAGMSHCGTEPASFLRYGELHDLHLFGVSIPCLSHH